MKKTNRRLRRLRAIRKLTSIILRHLLALPSPERADRLARVRAVMVERKKLASLWAGL